jgi:peptide-methionine (S)-S-oxide reductase
MSSDEMTNAKVAADKLSAADTQSANGESETRATATFAAGCFWGIEATFAKVPGVIETAVGYIGGSTDNPTYKQVCSGRTGHAEAVQVIYDPSKVSYEQLLNVFWKIHDPTQVNRQGPDIGSQYRSAIFTHNDRQSELAEASKESLNGNGTVGGRPVATIIEPASTFWRAEEYHQKYYEKHGMVGCSVSFD